MDLARPSTISWIKVIRHVWARINGRLGGHRGCLELWLQGQDQSTKSPLMETTLSSSIRGVYSADSVDIVSTTSAEALAANPLMLCISPSNSRNWVLVVSIEYLIKSVNKKKKKWKLVQRANVMLGGNLETYDIHGWWFLPGDKWG
jgi:hypothetical protein